MIHAVDDESSSRESMGDLMISQSMFMKTMTDENDAFWFSRNP